MTIFPFLRSTRIGWWMALIFMPLMAGCNALGPASAVISRAVPHYSKAQYAGLAHQTAAIMVWVDRGPRTNYPYLQLDVASGSQAKLKQIQADDNPDELKELKFPVRPEAVVSYQQDHPEIEAQSVTDVAAKFSVGRLIYIEVEDFTTRSDVDLYLGSITGNMKVIEIKDGKAKEAYAENNITVSFPKDSPKEGMPEGSDTKIYKGTLDKFTTEISDRLYTHQVDPD